MAQLTRKFLRALGVEEDKIDEIVTAHQDTLEEIKAERDSLKDNASKLAEAQAEVTRLSGELEKANKNGGDAAKIQADFDAYKQQVETDKRNAAKTAAVRAALKAAGAQREEMIDLLILKVDMDKVEMDGDRVKDPAALTDPLKASYGGCFGTTTTAGIPPVNPPTGDNRPYTRERIAGMSPEEINKNWDAIQKNLANMK